MKKIILLLTIFISFILFIPNIYALDISINDIEVLDKSDDVKISNVSRDNLTITPNITFTKPSDFVIFKIFFKGNDLKNNKIISITDNNNSEYIKTKYDYKETLDTPLYITITYLNKIDSNLTLKDLYITINLEDENSEEESIVINNENKENNTTSTNPQTGTFSHIITPIILIVISVFLIKYYSKYKDENTMMILILFLVLVPISVAASSSQKLTLIIKTSNIIIENNSSSSSSKPSSSSSSSKPKVYTVYLYPNGGTGIEDGYKLEYTGTKLFSEFPKVTKTNCTLDGWNVGSPTGKKYYKEVDYSDDGEKLYARWNCNSAGGFNIRTTSNASYKLDKQIGPFLESKGSSLENYNNFIKQKVKEAGMSTREGVVAAALATIYYLYDNYNTKLPYYWGGSSHMSYGISPKIGNYSPSVPSESGTIYKYDSFDCSGFTSWLVQNGGYKFTRVNVTGFDNIAGTKNMCDITSQSCIGKPGDFVSYKRSHIKMIVKIDTKNNIYYTAEATTSGVIVSTMGMHQAGNKKTSILKFDDFYNNSSNKNPY